MGWIKLTGAAPATEDIEAYVLTECITGVRGLRDDVKDPNTRIVTQVYFGDHILVVKEKTRDIMGQVWAHQARPTGLTNEKTGEVLLVAEQKPMTKAQQEDLIRQLNYAPAIPAEPVKQRKGIFEGFRQK